MRAAQRPTMLLRAIRPRARAAGGVGCGRRVPHAGARNVSKHIYHAVRTRATKRPPRPGPRAHSPAWGVPWPIQFLLPVWHQQRKSLKQCCEAASQHQFQLVPEIAQSLEHFPRAMFPHKLKRVQPHQAVAKDRMPLALTLQKFKAVLRGAMMSRRLSVS